MNDIKGGFVATVNSEKLPNGKVRGSVAVRVPPEHLDSFVLDLRKELGKQGELKGLRIGSQDITKQYTDLESRLRAARAMEERLLQIIKSGQGQIKDLLAAEKELGVWRTRIEEFEGELRYYQNLVSLSTLTITLYEKEIRSPYAIIQTERVQMGIEVEDVDKAHRAALAAVAEAKGRVTKSEMKQHTAGQFSAVLNFEVSPEAAGPLRDRLKQLGTVARLDVDRLQQEEGGTGRPGDAKVEERDTVFLVSFYNLANVAPRETVHLNLAAPDAEVAYKTIIARVEKSGRPRRQLVAEPPAERDPWRDPVRDQGRRRRRRPARCQECRRSHAPPGHRERRHAERHQVEAWLQRPDLGPRCRRAPRDFDHSTGDKGRPRRLSQAPGCGPQR